jgi:hypothetical protein
MNGVNCELRLLSCSTWMSEGMSKHELWIVYCEFLLAPAFKPGYSDAEI